MDVLFLGPGYPGEMPLFTRGLAEVGASVIGVGDQHVDALPPVARRALADYIQIASWADEDGAMTTILDRLRGRNIDLVETLWEPTVLLAARLREAIGTPGMTVGRDAPVPRQGTDEGGARRAPGSASRVPSARRTAAGCRDAAERIGYPLIVKPIAGAGSLDTYRVEHAGELEDALSRLLPRRRGQRRGVHRR